MQSILLPQGYQPAFDLSDNTEINVFVLETGYKMYQTMQKYYNALNQARQSINNEELLEENQALKAKHKLNIESLQREYDSVIEQLNNKMKLKNLAIEEEIESRCKVIANKYKKDEEEIIKKYQSQLDNELKRSSEYQAKLHAMNIALAERTKEIKECLEKEYQETICFERERYNTLSMQHTAISSILNPKPTNIVEIGNIGEEMIATWTRELFNTVEIIDTSGQTAKGDFHVKLQNKLFLFEIKNRIGIQRSDIDKFVRDVENNVSDIHGGLFISLSAASIPNKGDFSLEYIKEIPVIYLHVPDKTALKIAVKTLLFLNSKSDNISLTMTINQIYTNIKAMSAASISMSKSLDDAQVNLNSLKREIKNGLTQLDQLFNEMPEIKFEISSTALEYRPDEIKTILETYAKNKKAKMEDYIKSLNVNAKYLQDRGGAAKIKSMVQNHYRVAPNFTPVLTLPMQPPILKF